MYRTTLDCAAQRSLVTLGGALGLLGALVVPMSATAQSYTIRGITPLGGHSVTANAINANGIVVGGADRSDFTVQPYFWGPKVVYGVPMYVKTDIGTALSDESVAWGINSTGDIVGKMHQTDGVYRAFLYKGGQMHLLNNVGILTSTARAINDAGQIVGTCDVGTTSHAFLLNPGADAPIDLTPGISGSTTANAININGQVVGSITSGRNVRAFRYVNGGRTELSPFGGGANSNAGAVNDAGFVAGWSDTASGKRLAVRWVNGVISNLGTLGGNESTANGINNAGDIVGYSDTFDGQTAAFLWRPGTYGGTMINLNSLLPANSGWNLIEADGINDNGQIVGIGIYNGEQRGFRLTPIQVKSITITPSAVTGGSTAAGRVYLLDEAPINVTVYLQADFPYGRAVPVSVVVPAGSTSVGFTVTTSAVTTNTVVTVQARVPNGVIRSTTFNVVP